MNKRVIKFRVWDNVDYMSTNFTLQSLRDGIVKFTSDCEVMQFTGLLDKNGREIYEGDVFKSETNGISQIYFDTARGAWRSLNMNHGGGFYLSLDFADKGEVIGNIYQNPELLK